MKLKMLFAGLVATGLVQAQDITLKFQHIWPGAGANSAQVVEPWCKKVAADSNNRIKCQLFPSMSAGGTPPQLVDRVKDGVDDLVMTLPSYTAGRFPSLEVFELPFMTNSAEGAAKALWAYASKNSMKEFPGTKVLALWVHDEGYIHTNGKAVKTMADMKGLKIRTPHRQALKLMNALGASGVGMPPTAVQDAISKGTVDGAVFPWEGAVDFRVSDVAKFTTETPATRPAMYTGVFAFLMNQAKYDALPADLKAIIDRHSGAQLSAAMGKRWDESLAPAKKAALSKGTQVTVLTEAETDAWIKASAGSYDEWVADMNKRGANGAALLQEARDLIKKNK
ncbi:MAG: putative periplasmic component [Pseudomonadota bacterium]